MGHPPKEDTQTLAVNSFYTLGKKRPELKQRALGKLQAKEGKMPLPRTHGGEHQETRIWLVLESPTGCGFQQGHCTVKH